MKLSMQSRFLYIVIAIFLCITLFSCVHLAAADDDDDNDSDSGSFSKVGADARACASSSTATLRTVVFENDLGFVATYNTSFLNPGFRRGVIFVPESKIHYLSYACLARNVSEATVGTFIVLDVKTSSDQKTYGAIAQAIQAFPAVQYWTLAGHGLGGTLAFNMLQNIYPRVQGFIGFSSLVYPATTGALLFNQTLSVSLFYGSLSNIVTGAALLAQANAFLPRDSIIVPIPGATHDTFSDNSKSYDKSVNPTITFAQFVTAHLSKISLSVTFQNRVPPMLEVGPIMDKAVQSEGITILSPSNLNERWFTLVPAGVTVGSSDYSTRSHLVYFPGAKIGMTAYIPKLLGLVRLGHPVHLLVAPLGNMGQSPDGVAIFPNLVNSGRLTGVNRIVLAGHSAGWPGVTTAYLSGVAAGRITALVNIANKGTVNLVNDPIPQALIYGTNDGIFAANAAAQLALMNPATTVLAINGGNHANNAHYDFPGFGDKLATISRESQHQQIVALLHTLLQL